MKKVLANNFAIWTLLLFSINSRALSQQSCTDLGSSHPPFKWTALQPLILFTEYNPWAMAIGSDTPTFALYEDGTVIYWQGDRRSGQYETVKLSPSAVSQLIKDTHLDRAEVYSDCYSIFDGTDAPTNVLVVKTSQGYKSIDVYGSIRGAEEIPSARLPTDLQAAFKYLVAFNSDQAKPWHPPYFEVIIWPYTYAKSSLSWPSDLPDLTAKTTVKGKNNYYLFVPISQLNEYEAIMRKLKQKQAVLINGKKWTTSARFPFPHEGVPVAAEDAHQQ